ncbi:MAG: aminomethyl-transferring glycine dehydrogenase subunit GcvPA, partial [Candidatus Fermentibacteraceae bacterium]
MNRFVPNCKTLRTRMLEEIGVKQVEDLFTPVPEKVRMKGLLNLPSAMSEMELVREYTRLASSNTSQELVCFRGAGSYDHFIPAAVDSILTRSEFFTAYTPYQAEVSQGTLQAIFEYQTMIARLCGTEAANAGMYDGASATAEAALMAMRVTGVDRVLVAGSLNPSYREVIETYLVPGGFRINEIPFGPDGLLDPDALRTLMQGGAAAIMLQSPNYFGLVENIAPASEIARAGNALLVVVADPISLGVIEAPGALGADIVVGDGQPLGIPMGFGGPYAGFLATSTAHLRKMPGRIIGRTEDRAGILRRWAVDV